MGLKREDVIGDWRKLYSQAFTYHQYYLGDQIKEDELGRGLAHMEEKRNEYNLLVVKSEVSDGRVILKWILKK